MMLMASILFGYAGLNKIYAQVAITAPSLTVTACTAFPTSSITLGDIVITESLADDISGSGTLLLTTPSLNFEFTNAGTASVTGTEITGVSTVLTNPYEITLTFAVGAVVELNAITITGIQVRGISPAFAATAVTRTGGTSIINGDVNGTAHAFLTSNLAPELSSSLTPSAICSGAVFTYIPTSGTSNAVFAWVRPAVSGISEPASSGTDDPNEILTNTNTAPVNVTYIYTVSANGCTNPTTYSVVVTVNPTTTLSSSLAPTSICSNTVFSYTPTSLTAGTTFAWTRAAVSGISSVDNSGTDNPNETLIDTAAAPVNVTYVYTLSANGCANPTTYSVVVTVNPIPTLSSSLAPPAMCSGTVFNYTPTSLTTGAAFAWTRAAVIGISNAAGLGTGNPNETLTDTAATGYENVTYIFTVSANGCTNAVTYSVVVRVDTCGLCTYTLSSSLTPPAVCSGSSFNYVPTSTTPGAVFAWVRPAVTGINNAASSGTGNPNETLVNTSSAPINVTYTYTVTANGCTNPTPVSVVVKVNPTPLLSSTLAPPSVCGSTAFNYTTASATIGGVFTWTRAAVIGISNPANAGTGGVYEILLNTTADSVNVAYNYTVSANGCTNPTVYTVVVSIKPIPTVSLAPFATVCSTAPAFTLTGGSPAGGTYSGIGVDSGMFYPGSAGAVQTLSYTVIATNGCANSAFSNMTVNYCAGIEEIASHPISVYPNPSSGGIINIAVKNANFYELMISITDIQGKEVFSTLDKNISSDYNRQINIMKFAKGIYFIKLSTGADAQTQKLIVE